MIFRGKCLEKKMIVKTLLVFEYFFSFVIELYFMAILKENEVFLFSILIDLVLSSFLYFSRKIFFSLEIMNLILFFYALIVFNFYMSIFWIYILLKNIIRYYFFFKIVEKENTKIEMNEIDIEI